MTVAEKAVELKKNYNCCQAVAMALAEDAGLPEETLRQLAAGFGSGMGNMEGTCGALVGAVLVTGLKTQGQNSKAFARQISERFAAACGAIKCADLKGVGRGAPLCSCEDCVKNAVEAYQQVIG